MKIGSINVENNLIMGPMAGVTDLPFRMLCKEQGCGLMYTEMVSAKAIFYRNKNTDALMMIHDDEHPVGIQLFGSDADIMASMAKKAAEKGCDLIDVNMGCPVPKIVNNGDGSALMKTPDKVEEILAKMVAAVDIPVTVKIRKGFDESHVNAVEIAKRAENAGVSAIAVHGRTREQYYGGKADWDIIKAVKQSVCIPVIGNGDVASPEDAQKMFEYTGCDGVMIGRAARGNPWIFAQTARYLETGKKIPKPDIGTVKSTILRHAELQVRYKGEYTGIREMRKHVAWYTVGFPHSSRLRGMVNAVESYEQLKQLLDMYFV